MNKTIQSLTVLILTGSLLLIVLSIPRAGQIPTLFARTAPLSPPAGVLDRLYNTAESKSFLLLKTAASSSLDPSVDDDPFAAVNVAAPLPREFTVTISEHRGSGDRRMPLPKYFAGAECLVYGIGISDSIVFESEMARFCKVVAMDCTSPMEVVGPAAEKAGVAFRPWCVGKEKKLMNIDESRYTKGQSEDRVYEFYGLLEIMGKLGHEELTVLKFDIEGFEWSLFEEEILMMDSVRLPAVLVFELHAEGSNGLYVSPELVEGRDGLAVNQLFLKLWGLGYRTVSKNVNRGDPKCADFVLIRNHISASIE
eukprot:CAMPEP_0184732284 /NCGR_PEP_ID=MMETSP0314-20130426/53716_1 /TAXON_ID=38298 /ORGANISM="Rhodella maculata, Strain CCMP 736" /LENGTH=309 /DNA_ID=CAMNT_0027198839 /DNA_START=50 /DNA_END=979 /DNA_ORIENTATION=-